MRYTNRARRHTYSSCGIHLFRPVCRPRSDPRFDAARRPYAEPELTPNYRTPCFDLIHIYGGGPETSPFRYEGEPGEEYFKVGATTPQGYLRDLQGNRAWFLIGDLQDTRNLDNLILRQLHVVFLKFHNEAIETAWLQSSGHHRA